MWRWTKMASDCHKSSRLEKLMGKKVKIVFFDDTTRIGILGRDEYRPGRYMVDNMSFYKTHVKEVHQTL